jgi:rhodanese-related sulfurtransferase
MKTIDPKSAARMLASGEAVLVDIREPDEHARERIETARNAPISKLGERGLGIAVSQPVIFHCKSGARTTANASALARAAACEAFILEGGIEAWKAAGLEVSLDRRQPLEIMRQAQIVAGAMVVASVVLGWLAHPGFFGFAAFVGAGLAFAGVTGWCGMAKALALMPWNRRAAT